MLVVTFPCGATTFNNKTLIRVLLRRITNGNERNRTLIRRKLISTRTVVGRTTTLALRRGPQHLSRSVRASTPIVKRHLLYATMNGRTPTVIARTFATLRVEMVTTRIRMSAYA